MICEENGQIIVDELRPMSEHLMDGAYILVWHKDGEAIGWIPMPIYRSKDGE